MTNTSVLGNSGNVTVTGTFGWAGGTLGSTDGTATGTVNIAGITSMTTSTVKLLNKKTLNLNTGANYSGNSQLSLRYNSVLNIPSGQSFVVNTTSSASRPVSNGGGTINIGGAFEKQGSGSDLHTHF